MGAWRNGSASDSRSEGWEFESLCPHDNSPRRNTEKDTQESDPGSENQESRGGGLAEKPQALMDASWLLAAWALFMESGKDCCEGDIMAGLQNFTRGYGATAARLTPDQKVVSSNLSGLTLSIVHRHKQTYMCSCASLPLP